MNKQSGNVLFLILIAVALFAALSYAVTQSSRGGGNSDAEIFKAEISRIDNFHSSLRAAITRMRIIKGVELDELDMRAYAGASGNIWLRNNGMATRLENDNCASDDCRVFHINGGGVVPIILDDKVIGLGGLGPSAAVSGHGVADSIRIDGIGSQDQDIIVVLQGANDDFCQSYNSSRGIIGIPIDDRESYEPIESSFSFNDDGSYGYGNNATELSGKDAFCVRFTTSLNGIVLVIVER
jgi:hypothetical protein